MNLAYVTAVSLSRLRHANDKTRFPRASSTPIAGNCGITAGIQTSKASSACRRFRYIRSLQCWLPAVTTGKAQGEPGLERDATSNVQEACACAGIRGFPLVLQLQVNRACQRVVDASQRLGLYVLRPEILINLTSSWGCNDESSEPVHSSGPTPH